MTPSLSTQILRALSALPLLAVALAAAVSAGTPPTGTFVDDGVATIEIVVPGAPVTAFAAIEATQGVATTLPGDALASGPRLDCAAGALAPGARGLARMPGDITTVADRLRCAQ